MSLTHLLPLVLLAGCHGHNKSPGVTADDRSFYQEIDTKDWPGDDLSEAQTLAAIQRFRDPDACRNPWRWALIGPNALLLKGTSYLVRRRLTAAVPNVSYSKGYWGGTPLWDPIPSVDSVKRMVERYASDDCKYEHE